MTTQQRVALEALKAALKGEVVAHVEYDDKVQVGTSSNRRFTVDGFGSVTEQ
jgi:hypothetical protein